MIKLQSGSMPSVMQHSFSVVPKADIERSSMDRSHGHKTTFDAGYLIPIYVDEALPGDTFNLSMTAFARLATPIKPIMDNMFLESFFFAVPYRLVWNNWQKFNGEQIDPGDSTDYIIPTMVSPAGGYLPGELSDYLGIPISVEGLEFSSLWHRAYNLIWNEWFRDQNLQDSVVVDKDDGPDSSSDYVLLRRGKRHDYFTSCLPWPQKGTAVELPLGSVAPVKGIGKRTQIFSTDYASAVYESDGTSRVYTSNAAIDAANDFRFFVEESTSHAGYPNIYADLGAATAATINQIRQAFQVQKLYERDARGGSRYTEIVRAHFGVTSPDARLQRPEYLGGGTSMVNISPIPQTNSTTVTSPQGNLAAAGTVNVSGHGFTKSFTEHCLLIGLVCVRADLNYQQGLNRMFSRSTRFDFYWPSLSHIGEQPVLNKEIYAQADANDELVFGYQERYAEYRYKPSLVTGLFRSGNTVLSLDVWHLAQDFSTLPVLGNDFIQENPPVDRVIAVPAQPHFLFDSYIKLKCARPMPVYSVPGLIDHF